jgi:hypothetical protein
MIMVLKLLKNFIGYKIGVYQTSVKGRPWLILFWICLWLDLTNLFKRRPSAAD